MAPALGLYSSGISRSGTARPTLALWPLSASIASHAGGPFIAEASPSIVGCESIVHTPNHRDWAIDPAAEQRWQVLRESDAAGWVGLALQRLLLRLPYGEGIDEIDAFEFEELADPEQRTDYLWGNPAVGCAVGIAMAFRSQGWQLAPDGYFDLEDLPTFSYAMKGETRLAPCAEAYLSEAAVERIQTSGLIPLTSVVNSNRVRVLRLQTVSTSATALARAWA